MKNLAGQQLPPTRAAHRLQAERDIRGTGPDATVENHGSIVLVRPHTRAARDWIRDNVEDTAQYFGQALAIEPRYVAGLVEGMTAAGLVLA
jgi:hypothetical protein